MRKAIPCLLAAFVSLLGLTSTAAPTADRPITVTQWLRLKAVPAKPLVLVDWPGALRVVAEPNPAHAGLAVSATLTTPSGAFVARSRPCLPVSEWALVSVTWTPQAETQSHLSWGTQYRPQMRQTGLLTIAVCGAAEEPFGVNWIAVETVGSPQPTADAVNLGPQLPIAEHESQVLDGLQSVAQVTMTWLRDARSKAGRPAVDAITAAPAATPGAPAALRLVPTYQSVGVYLLHASPLAPAQAIHVRYRAKGQPDWRAGLDLVHDAIAGQSRGSLLELVPDNEYEVECQVQGAAPLAAATRTWPAAVPIGETRYLPETSSEPLVISDRGRPDAWILYRPKPGASAIIDAGAKPAHAVLFKDAAYVILENATLRGGAVDCVSFINSHDCRVRRCDVAGWGDPGTRRESLDKGLWVDKNGRLINLQAGVRISKDSRRITVEGNYIHEPRGTANCWAHGHPAGPQAVINDTTLGQNVIRDNDCVGSETHWWNDAIESVGNGSVFGGPYRDTDINGNYLAFANDDSTELDGGQINVRFWNNRAQWTYTGLSGAPCLRGPCYVFNNVLADLGDERLMPGAGFKMGTGPIPWFGVTFILHNTLDSQTGSALNSTNTSATFIRIAGDRWPDVRASGPMISRNNIYGLCALNYPEYPALLAGGSFARDMMAPAALRGQAQSDGLIHTPPQYVNAAAGDYRPKPGSPACGAALPMPGGASPAPRSLGALEPGAPVSFPPRPYAMDATPQTVRLDARVGAKAPAAMVTLSVPPSTGKRWTAHSNAPWLTCEPSQGASSDQPVQVRVGVAATSARPHRGAITFRTDEGFCRTVAVSAEARLANPYVQVIEAESASLSGRMTRREDPSASALAFIATESVTRKVEESKDKAVFLFDAPEDGDYFILARVMSPGPDITTQDSFFFSLDGSEPELFQTRPSGPGAWDWRLIRPGGVWPSFRLKKGPHRLTLLGRESLTGLDAIAITNSPYEEPPAEWRPASVPSTRKP